MQQLLLDQAMQDPFIERLNAGELSILSLSLCANDRPSTQLSAAL